MSTIQRPTFNSPPSFGSTFVKTLANKKPTAGKTSNVLWKLLFFSIVAGYCLYYASFGMNETDGGFLTGLAWQVLNGKLLYHDIVYVRPPLPVWLRALELQLLPEHFAVLGERWFFYGKVALYSWLGAVVAVLPADSSAKVITEAEASRRRQMLKRVKAQEGGSSSRRWRLAVLGFVVSAHCYPAMAWHTVDGILFAVMAAYFTIPELGTNWTIPKKSGLSNFYTLGVAGACLFCSLLCKQSFYPLLPLFALFLFFEKENRREKMAWFFGAFLLCTALFVNYLSQKNILSEYLQMTSGAASGGQAWQHGVLDYFRITPELALPSLLLLTPVAWWFWKRKNPKIALITWSVWLLSLVASYVAITWLRQEHTVPFAQSRAMFWVGAIYFLTGLTGFTPPSLRGKTPLNPVHPVNPVPKTPRETFGPAFLLLGISWCASVSWGYNLPILFATPWVWAGMEVTRVLIQPSSIFHLPSSIKKWGIWVMLLTLLLSFRVGYEFVYRDGRRSEMTESMGAIFPPLSGIYSNRETAALYRDLKQLAERYGPNFKTLPAFPQSNFLTKTPAPLPLDWVVNRETNGDNSLIINNLKEKRPVLFIQKSFREKIETDPEMEVTRRLYQTGTVLEETPNFWVISNDSL